MNDKNSELKPCPFCGGEAEMRDNLRCTPHNGYSVICKDGLVELIDTILKKKPPKLGTDGLEMIKTMANVTDYLYNEALQNLETGSLGVRPIDDMFILAYDITQEELEPYRNSKYLGIHSSDILDLILGARNGNT